MNILHILCKPGCAACTCQSGIFPSNALVDAGCHGAVGYISGSQACPNTPLAFWKRPHGNNRDPEAGVWALGVSQGWGSLWKDHKMPVIPAFRAAFQKLCSLNSAHPLISFLVKFISLCQNLGFLSAPVRWRSNIYIYIIRSQRGTWQIWTNVRSDLHTHYWFIKLADVH